MADCEVASWMLRSNFGQESRCNDDQTYRGAARKPGVPIPTNDVFFQGMKTKAKFDSTATHSNVPARI